MGKLCRAENKVFGGVCAGVAKYFRWDVRQLRLFWAVFAVLTFGALAIFYVLLWMLLPQPGKKESYESRMNRRLGRK